jgi:hypothetical protein
LRIAWWGVRGRYHFRIPHKTDEKISHTCG